MDIEDQRLMIEFQDLSSDAEVLNLKYRLMKLERLQGISSPEFDPIELAKVKGLLEALGQSHEL
jgi:hypothetical protein